MYQALYRKWRPRTFDDVVGQSHITDTLKRQVQEGRLSHAYLFTGTRGTGKTTCAKILARAANCENPVDGNPCNACPACMGIENGSILDVLELDAASNNGVDQVRALRDEAVYSPAAVRKRVYIVDEVHMLSTAAFNALLKILEEPPEHLMFILATTELHKVPATIKSRCQQFSFKRISPTDIAGRLKYVAGEEGIPLTADGAMLLARLANGGLRDALSLLDQCATGSAGGDLGEQEILDALGLAGNVETAALMGAVADHDAGDALERLDRLYRAGKDVGSLLSELSALARDLLIRKTAPRGGAALLTGGYDETTLRNLAERLTAPRLAQVLSRLQAASADLGRSTNRRVDVELCLIRLCDETLDDSSAGLNARLARLEDLAAGGTLTSAPIRTAKPESTSSAAEELPPWDLELQPLPEKTTEEKVLAAPKIPVKEQQPLPSARTTIGGGAAGDFWPGLVAGLKGRIPMGEYSFLSNPVMVKGTLDSPVLTLWAQNDFVKNMVSKPGILAAVEKAAGLLPGAPYRAVVTVGEPLAAAPGFESGDKLEELLAMGQQFDNIIIKE
ncbi:MAG: DNA polymerase III subunit gamma/tau [Pseudoflavonifractor sp.]|nr:DNA polymerase III subunit gamma/tau [Pseudoflavonifractor sp.]